MKALTISCRRLALLAALLLSAPAFAAEPDDVGKEHLPAALSPPPNLLQGLPPAPKPPRPADADAATYDKCMQLARAKPAEAKALAEGWAARGGKHPAEHCLAVALIGLKQYRPAAERLDKLAEAMAAVPPLAELRAGVLAQAGQAWLLAGDPSHAYADAGAALSLHPDDAEILIDRAEAAGSAGWYDKAVEDLDRVLKADPARVEALVYRASAYRELGRLDPAMADLETALKKEPNSVPALLERGNIRGLKGDLDGARQDWRRVAALAPGSPAESAAKANLDHLDTPEKATAGPKR
ncbi:MAG TPA: tetratricopeptide repeat protein [Stellaceae bacterium]